MDIISECANLIATNGVKSTDFRNVKNILKSQISELALLWPQSLINLSTWLIEIRKWGRLAFAFEQERRTHDLSKRDIK
jgi:hypothetical protein